ncbi:class I glutamine amidotransferase-like protein [Pestalotiopsis sp. NC0098]|nr:class I glutamine amidotransferase-like protein [Pestalotiopsis sp. NC0098]
MAIGEDQRPARRPGVVHVAVLECETLPGPIVETYGGFADIFDQWLQTGVDKVNSKRPPQKRTSVEVSRWPVVHGVYPSDVTRIDAFIITGSICSAYDDFPWIRALEEFVRVVYDTHPHIKFFGGCFGHQVLARVLLGDHGVEVVRAEYGWENGVHDVHLTPQFVAHFPFLQGQAMRYQFLHSDEVVVSRPLPRGWLSVGSSDMCKSQGLYQPGRVLTYQGHPEFDRRILYYFTEYLGSSGMIDNDVYETSLKLIDRDSTSQLAAEVVVRFLEI